MRFQLHDLELVYPPISNQEAEWLQSDLEVTEIISKSNLYFIGQKPETFFVFEDDVVKKMETEQKIYFTYHSGQKKSDGYIDIRIIMNLSADSEPMNLDIELGKKLIRIWNLNNNEVIQWFTTDKILFDKSRDNPFIGGFKDFKQFFVYNLHYVGISKKDDSFSRLVIKPHDKRLRVLSNEHPLNHGSRLTDEIVLFFFRVKSQEIKQFITDEDFEEIGENELGDYIRIIADAEKAFIKIMNSKYNEVKFESYPKSIDGLYNTSVAKHTYSIDEDVTFITDTNSIRGARKKLILDDQGDFIAISKTNVELIKIDESYFS